ncbi:tRNA lysidine(34) synthetase TilS [Erysipelotrichaceae bacterium OttesenSCG-928-M19]|nr:tRNA lysidine(34) synthetase TilS [Erysipelotrichaceae bacterium OttesenSCG-928-M19]
MIVVAVSAGIDSMVLLDYLYHQNEEIVIAHVNYQKREDSYLDALTIKEYIKDKEIIFEQLIVNKEDYTNENFQAQARHIRYDFFEYVAKKYHTDQVYVAHHRDDFLETYLFQKERTGLYNYYGIQAQTNYRKLVINRPLLNYYKEDLENYANSKQINYHEDYSNYEFDYTRNVNRNLLGKLSIAEKEKIYEEAMASNKIIEQENAFVNNNLVNYLSIEYFLSWPENIQRRWLFKQIKKYDITLKYLDEIIRKIKHSNNFKVTFLDTTIVKAYAIIYVLDYLLEDYSYLITNDAEYDDFINLWQQKYNYPLIKKEMKYPFTIRNYNRNDLDGLGIDYKKFRLKIKKNKVPFFLRDYLPVIVKDNEVFFIFNY